MPIQAPFPLFCGTVIFSGLVFHLQRGYNEFHRKDVVLRMGKLDKRFWITTVLLLVLCVATQFLGRLSVYLSAGLVGAFLLLAVLRCGYLSGALLALLTPLTNWLIVGSPALSEKPFHIVWLILGELLFVSLFWVFAIALGEKYPLKERIRFSDPLFRVVLIVAAAACALWACLAMGFLSALGDLFQVESFSPLLISVLIGVIGCFLLFSCLWMLVTRFPRAWALLAGVVSGLVAKAFLLHLTVIQAASGEVLDAAKQAYGIPLFIGTFLGCAVLIGLWLPLQHRKEK